MNDQRRPAQEAGPILTIDDLSVAYGPAGRATTAVRGVSFAVHPGEVVALIGESGSGKTTVARSIVGLLGAGGHVTGGEITFLGESLTTVTEQRMRTIRGFDIGVVPQDPGVSLDPLVPVGHQVAEVLRVHDLPSRQSVVVDILERAGLSDAARWIGHYPHQLSGGMQQRVLIAIAIACGPKLVIADEPTSALDVTAQRRVLDQLTELTRASQTALLLITHDLGVAADRAQRLLVMKDGQLVEEGELPGVLTQAQHPYTRHLLAAVPDVRGPRLVPSPGTPTRPGDDAARASLDLDTTPPLLSVTGLSKTFRLPATGSRKARLHAVDGISFAVPKGRTLALVGESGSGKSTTARLVLRLERADSGSIVLDGDDITHLRGRRLHEIRRRMQIVHQNPFATFDPRGTIGSLVEEPLRAFKEPDRRNRVTALLDRVALPRTVFDRKASELSGGQLQRAAIARALTLNPDLVVLDEPVSALDVSIQAEVLQLLVDLQAEFGLSYLFISHDLGVVKKLADRVAVMRFGQLVESGPAHQIFTSPQHDYTRELLDAVPGTARALQPHQV